MNIESTTYCLDFNAELFLILKINNYNWGLILGHLGDALYISQYFNLKNGKFDTCCFGELHDFAKARVIYTHFIHKNGLVLQRLIKPNEYNVHTRNLRMGYPRSAKAKRGTGYNPDIPPCRLISGM